VGYGGGEGSSDGMSVKATCTRFLSSEEVPFELSTPQACRGQMEVEETTNESRGLVGGGGGQMAAEGTTNESRGLVGGGGGGQMEAEGTTNESQGLVGGGGGQMEVERTTNESRGLVGGGGGQMEVENAQTGTGIGGSNA
jgi:hypothetical protein